MTKIAVYGANGYTATLVVAELARRGAEAVLVGRNPERLRATAARAGMPDAEVRVAELSGAAEALHDADVVINGVAPYITHGTPVVRAAIAAGAHYVDFAGEQAYITGVFGTFAGDAERAGVTVVPMVNDSGFLADLIASLTTGRLGQVENLTIAHRFPNPGGFSRGSMRTVLANLERFSSAATAPPVMMTFPDGDTAPMVGFAMAELATIPRHIEVGRLVTVTDDAVRGLAAATPESIDQLPSDGPSEAERRAAKFLIVADAADSAGRRVRTCVEGEDTYGTTAFTAVEAALLLAKGTAKPGVLAPAQAFDPEEFLDSLAVQGVRWRIEP